MRGCSGIARTVVWLASALMLAGCSTPGADGGAGLASVEGIAATSPSRQVTQVVVIATQHFITDQPDGYTPAHLRALLARVNPHVLAVEASANERDPWQTAPFELLWVTRPWAAEHAVAAVPAGWGDSRYEIKQAQMFDSILAAGKDSEYRRIESDFQSASAAQPLSCQAMNSPEAAALWRGYHASLHSLYGGDTPWEQSNAKIVQNILAICRQHPGQRIAVVFGGAHVYYIEDALARAKDVQVIPAASFFPLPDAEIEAQVRPIDHLLALRLLNFPTIAGAAMPKLQGHLDELRRCSQFVGDYHLFNGKMLLHRRQPELALAEFQAVAALDPKAISAFDGRSRLREAGIINAAIVRKLLGEVDQARHDLEALLKETELSAGTRDWAQRVLEGMPK